MAVFVSAGVYNVVQVVVRAVTAPSYETVGNVAAGLYTSEDGTGPGVLHATDRSTV